MAIIGRNGGLGGIGDSVINSLREEGWNSPQDLIDAGAINLANLDRITLARAEAIIEFINQTIIPRIQAIDLQIIEYEEEE